ASPPGSPPRSAAPSSSWLSTRSSCALPPAETDATVRLRSSAPSPAVDDSSPDRYTVFMTRSALVTGGNSGIGLAIAEALGKAGYKLWITGRDKERGAQAAQKANAEFLVGDFSTAEQTKAFAKDFKSRCGGKLDVLVHSTGVLNSKRRAAPDGT